MRDSLQKRSLPVNLEDKPKHALRFPLTASEPLTLRICEFVAEYESILRRTRPARTELVYRNVIESNRLFARHLPLCPPVSQHDLLPDGGADCVACSLEYDVSPWSYACFILRVQGTPGLLTAELYLTAAPKALGMVAMRAKGIKHFVSSWGGSPRASEYRHRNQDSPVDRENEEAKEKGERVLHFVENAMDLASASLQKLSAASRMQSVNGRARPALTPQTTTRAEERPAPPRSAPAPQSRPKVEEVQPPPQEIQRKVRRRGEDV